MPTHAIIRDRLRQEMVRRSLTAVELARSAGVKNSFIYDILNGKSTNPSSIKLAMVADSLGLSLSYLAGAADQPLSGTASPANDIIAITHLAADNAKTRAKKEVPYVYFSQQWIRDQLGVKPDQLRALVLTGESMAPTFHHQDLLLVDTGSTSPSPPGIFVLSDGVGLIARRLELASAAKPPMLRIISDNPQYGTHERALREVQIIGRVAWFARQL